MSHFVIWSFEHRQWWRADRQGYTPDLAGAGRYGAEEAGEIVAQSPFLEELAIPASFAERHGAPKTHPYTEREDSFRSEE